VDNGWTKNEISRTINESEKFNKNIIIKVNNSIKEIWKWATDIVVWIIIIERNLIFININLGESILG
jgi:hypothetical protein